MALELSPTSGGWRNLCGSSIAYGLTEGGYNASQITLTALGRRVVAPTEEGDNAAAKIEAALQSRVLREFFERYNHAKFPKDDIARNVLVQMGLPKDRSERALEILKANSQFCGIVHQTKTGPFVALEGSGQAAPSSATTWGSSEQELAGGLDAEADQAVTSLPPAPGSRSQDRSSGPRQLFVAHGKNHKPLEDLKKILNEFKIPFKVAIDEANKGRPISAKVAELMRECSAGIFVFTKDEKFLREKTDGSGTEEVWRPSENVVYELGAASIQWDRKIIIVREDGVNFPTDFSDLGYITFRDGEISSKALEILKELVALGLVTFSAA
jgi:predicted nucleotide-binding protein